MKRLLLAALLVFPCAVSAQPVDCSDGVKYDDGTFETGLGYSFGTRAHFVQRIDPPAGGGQLTSVCLCWQRADTDTSVFFDIYAWAADGPDGGPGTLLGKLPTQSATGVSSSNSKFYRYDVSSLGINATSPIYVGPLWSPNQDRDFYVCMDESVSTPQRPAYVDSSLFAGIDPPRVKLGQVGTFPEFRAFGIRAVFGPLSTACVPGPNRLCLNQGRFAVEATFNAPGQPPGTASVVKLTDETGYLWFFNSSNVEAVVKVLNACGLNQKYWVFAGGLTDVQVTLTVTDTQTGNSKTYTNPQGTAFRPIQDTAALPCQ